MTKEEVVKYAEERDKNLLVSDFIEKIKIIGSDIKLELTNALHEQKGIWLICYTEHHGVHIFCRPDLSEVRIII